MREKGELDYFSKKERASMEKEYIRLNDYLSGIREMKDMPGAVFIVDINKESIAVAEAKKLHLPVVALVDTNCNPDWINFPIPSNDDATRTISLFVNSIADAVRDGRAHYEAHRHELEAERRREKVEVRDKKASGSQEKVAEVDASAATAGEGAPA